MQQVNTSARQRAFKQVDVFSPTPFLGNALAVVLDGTDLSDAQMQSFARWTNLAETTFLLPPTPEAAAQGADYRVRIFTTNYEMPFAGHPTLGSCHAWLEAGGGPRQTDRIVQECEVGLVHLTREGPSKRLAFAAPPLTRTAPSAELLSASIDALGLQPRQVVAAHKVCNGPNHFSLLLDGPHTVLELTPNFALLGAVMRGHGVTGIGVAGVEPAQAASHLIARSNREARAFGTSTTVMEPSVEVRFFADGAMVSEDPVTGSFNASLAQWLIADGYAPTQYVAAQGTCLGGEGRVHIREDAQGQVWVSGDTLTCINGTVQL
jgi:PhzF family phenazine biosynthesis protein